MLNMKTTYLYGEYPVPHTVVRHSSLSLMNSSGHFHPGISQSQGQIQEHLDSSFHLHDGTQGRSGVRLHQLLTADLMEVEMSECLLEEVVGGSDEQVHLEGVQSQQHPPILDQAQLSQHQDAGLC